MKVRALYDFSGEPKTSELTIVTGDVLTVTRQDVGEGWWEGTNDKGQTGLFPAAYVEEEKSSNPPSMPPPPLPESFANDWDNQQSTDNQTPNYEAVDYWDDEWDDDSENGAPPSLPHKDHPPVLPPKSYAVGDDMSVGSNRSTMPKKNVNRFSLFAKSGGENYIMGTLKLNIPEADKIYIIEDQGQYGWNPVQEHYTVMVASPKKDSKFKGLKSFIAYQLTPTFNNIQVSRRYKHFDWLHERLEEKFSLIPIPPLPDKQISGRYEGQFIERRKNQLQAFVDCVCRHPVLSRCAVWEHFVTCTDDKRWKPGKRKAEKDELTGANYFLAIQAPEKPLQIFIVEQDTEKCSRFVHSMDGAVKNLMACSVDQTKKHQGHYKREYQKIGQSFCDLAHAFALGETSASPSGLTDAIRYAGDTYNDIGSLFEEQPKHDWEPLGDLLHIYKGILTAFPDILNVHKDAMQKRKECERLETEHKMDASQVAEVQRRTDVISYALLAEINHFHAERAAQVRSAMRAFLSEQAAFYQKVAAKLQDAYSLFEE